jgi:hypothetical protein
MSWSSQQGNNLTVNNITAAAATLSGSVTAASATLSGGLTVNGSGFQINSTSTTNAHIDLSAYQGNSDYDVRFIVAKGASTSGGGQGKLTVSAAAGAVFNGPVTATKYVTSASSAPMPASVGSTASGEMRGATVSPSNNAHTYTVSNTAPCFGVLLCNSTTYTRLISNPTSEQAFTEPENEDEEPEEYTKYTWTVSLKGSGADPQPNVGNLSFVIF